MYPRFRTSPDSLLVIVGINIIIPEQWATLPHEFIHINKQFMLYDRLRSFNSVTSGNAAAHLCLKCGGLEPCSLVWEQLHARLGSPPDCSQEVTWGFTWQTSNTNNLLLISPACCLISEGKVHTGNSSPLVSIYSSLNCSFFFLKNEAATSSLLSFHALRHAVFFVFFPSVASLARGFSHQSQHTGSVSS